MATGGTYQAVHDSSSDVPLFGAAERTSRERVINVIVGFITAFVVFFTMISAFIFEGSIGRGLNITFALVIAMICGSHLLLGRNCCSFYGKATNAQYAYRPGWY